MRTEIWEIGEGREQLWKNHPARAARLAYLQVVALWHRQVEEGAYHGIPNLCGERYCWGERDEPDEAAATLPSRPVDFRRDESAGAWLIPGRIRRVYEGAA